MRARLLVALGLALALLGTAAGAGGAVLYAWDAGRSDLVAEGVRVAGVDVGGLRAAAARERLERTLVPALRRPLLLVAGNRRLVASRSIVRVDADALVAEAVRASRRAPLRTRLLRAVLGRRVAETVALRGAVRPADVDALVARVADELDRPARSARVVPTAQRLLVVPGRSGLAVDRDLLRVRLAAALVEPARRSLAVPLRVVPPRATAASLARRYPSYLLVDRARFTLRLYRRLRLFRTYRVAVGQAGLETPAGLYRIRERELDPPWRVPLSAWAGDLAGKTVPPGPADPIKARWLGFSSGAGIHGTDALSSLGTAASHGCIRMSIPDVIELYPLVPLGTPIFVG